MVVLYEGLGRKTALTYDALAPFPRQHGGQARPGKGMRMLDYMSLEEQVDADFGRARRKAFLRRLLTRLRRGPSPERLPCFEDARRKLGAVGGVRIGQRVVRLSEVVGSVGRCSQFDGAFMPTSDEARTRWERIDRAFHRGEELLPVSLYKIGETYFVLDGNHRVSVYRYHGVEWVDAVVTEFRAGPAKNRTGTPVLMDTRGSQEGENDLRAA